MVLYIYSKVGRTMSISKINFMAESNYLSQIYNKTAEKSQAAAPAATPETKTEPETLQTNEQQKNNKVRNWSIGLSSAAVLIGLGVLGRRGHLGEGVQKLLGGAKKNASDLEQEIERKLNSIEDDIETNAENTASRTVEDDLSRAINDEASESARLNAVINDLFEGVPRKIEVPDPTPIIKDIEQIDISKIKGDYENFKLPNGNTRMILLKNNKLDGVTERNSNGKRVMEVFFHNKGKLSLIRQNDIHMRFNQNGELISLTKDVNDELMGIYTPDGNLSLVQIKQNDNSYITIRAGNSTNT